MTESGRNSIFISHANPQDNAFALWLGSRLAAAGYIVWADVLRLRGGHDWQRRLEHALREEAVKMLLVGTPEAVDKQGVRNEVQIAHSIGKRLDDPEYIIPLKLRKFDAPFLIAHSQYIDFEESWASGLAELLVTLDEEYTLPPTVKSSNNSIRNWVAVQLRHQRVVHDEPEELVSNWVSIKSMPRVISYLDFRSGIQIQLAKERIRTAPWPIASFRRGFISFCKPEDLESHFGPDLPLVLVGTIDLDRFLAGDWPDERVTRRDALSLFSSLARQAIERAFIQRGLKYVEMSNGERAWFGAIGDIPLAQIPFTWGDNLYGRRQITGFSKKRNIHWHYGVSARVSLFPHPHFRIISRVVFSEDGKKPLDSTKRMHNLRRSFTRSWRNARWRDMLLAFLYWFAKGEQRVSVPLGGSSALVLSLPTEKFQLPVSIGSDANLYEEGEESDALDIDDPSLQNSARFDDIEEGPTQ